MNPAITPKTLDLKRDTALTVQWADGKTCIYPISLLRTMCPCAQCRQVREGEGQKKKTSLSILPGNFSTPLTASAAELVGNYAIRIDWSDGHATGIYSFEYLREICPEAKG
jgi:DUF971 family protein